MILASPQGIVPVPSGAKSTDLRRDGVFATKMGFYLLWLEYLAVSPSYELARRCRAGTLTAEDEQRLPADFDAVLAVYDDLGDVQRISFDDWWRARGLKFFGFQSQRPRVRRLGTLRSGDNSRERLTTALGRYIDEAWVSEAEQTTMVVALPIGLGRTKLMKDVGRLLRTYEQAERNLTPSPPKYPIVGKRQRKDTLFRYLMVLWVRSLMHDRELWRVGVRARVSDTYSRELDVEAKPKANEATYDRMMLSVMTSRAYQRSVLIAENAARGQFPTYAPCEHAVQPDLPKLYRMISSRRRWKKEKLEKRREELSQWSQHNVSNM